MKRMLAVDSCWASTWTTAFGGTSAFDAKFLMDCGSCNHLQRGVEDGPYVGSLCVKTVHPFECGRKRTCVSHWRQPGLNLHRFKAGVQILGAAAVSYQS